MNDLEVFRDGNDLPLTLSCALWPEQWETYTEGSTGREYEDMSSRG